MAKQDMRIADPAAHRPTKTNMEADVSIDGAPEALEWAVTRVGAERREDESLDRSA